MVNESLSSLEEPNGVSLYFHIPFCSRKCPYCHFFVVPNHEHLKAAFEEALLREWNLRKHLLSGKSIVSIYFGGGTPSTLPPSFFSKLLETISADCQLKKPCEITLEANPEHLSLELMQRFHRSGINRISLGVQSLYEPELLVLKRQHTAEKALQAIHYCAEAGYTQLSIDLMFELPGQTLHTWEKSLNRITSLPITHLSLYNLTFEPHTVFYRKRHQLLSQIAQEEEKLAMLNQAVFLLENNGLQRYEISAFSKLGSHSVHNIGYWLGRPFLGFGPSAFSYWDKARFSNCAHFTHYIQQIKDNCVPIDFHEKLTYPKNLHELLAVQLRLIEGVDLAHFQQLHGELPSTTLHTLHKLVEEGYISFNELRMTLTEKGLLFYDLVGEKLS